MIDFGLILRLFAYSYIALIAAVNDVFFFDTGVFYHDCNSMITTLLWFHAV